MADEWKRIVECEDAAGRPRSVHVFPSADNRAALKVPPGDACVLTDDQLGDLQAKLYELSAELHRRGSES